MGSMKVTGLVVRTVDLSESDKLLSVYTQECGMMTIMAKGSRTLKSRYMAVAQPFCYASFLLSVRGDYYWLREAELIESFFDLRNDLVVTALASYFCDVICDVGVNTPEPSLLSLILNSLYALTQKNFDPRLVKAAFEFRAAALLGFYPDVAACADCGDTVSDCVLDVMNGCVLCGACREKRMDAMVPDEVTEATRSVICPLTQSARLAIEYVLTCPPKRIFAFRLNDENDLRLFCRAAEEYLLNHLERGFKTLDFYNSLI